ncbi:MAG TPA: intradiol ring-cleavage dioxygenase [Polyangiaceae bacterium]|nr:intradiol ring-cleavage dioxygenase [Polyangiaceae bacterium]
MKPSEEARLTRAVAASLAGCRDERFRAVMTELVKRLHAFVRETELTEAEWLEAIEFLTATGKLCDAKRQEFILLSDVLGVSTLIDEINHRGATAATETTVLGPFYVDGAPEVPNGADISGGLRGEPVYITGRVLTAGGEPVAGAALEVWQVRPDALYDVQDAAFERQGLQLRARLRAGPDGRYAFRTLAPVSYAVPTDGPVGALLRRAGRHPMRPAHVHFIVQAPGFERIVTHLFPRGDPYLDSDTVFGVRDSLVVDFRPMSAAEAAAAGQEPGVLRVDYDFRLTPADSNERRSAPAGAARSST